MASRACWMCTRNYLGVPFDQTGTYSTLWGNMNFSMLALESTASWMTSFSGMYRIGGLLLPVFLSHSWGLRPSGVTFMWLILAAASLRCVPKNRVLKTVWGTVNGVRRKSLCEQSTLTTHKRAFVTCGWRTGGHNGVQWMVYASVQWRLRDAVRERIG